MKLKTQTTAPAFSAESLSGKTVSLEDYKNKNLLVKFYRFATCPVCNLHLRNFVKQYDELKKEGLEVVIIYHSPKWRMEKNFPQDIPFELLSDPGKNIFRKYGVESSLAGMFSWRLMRDYMLALKAGYPTGMLSHDGGVMGHPADFIINKQGKIVFAHYGKNYADSLSIKQVIDVLRKIQPESKIEEKTQQANKELTTA
jgi:peroxiredoxin